MIVPRAWSAQALHTRALGSSARYVRLRMSSMAITRRALLALLGLAQMSTRQTASTVWTVGIQRSEYASSALFQMSSLLTELAVWILRFAQREVSVQCRLDAVDKKTAVSVQLVWSALLEDTAKRAVTLERLPTATTRSASPVCPAVLHRTTGQLVKPASAPTTRQLASHVLVARLQMSSMPTIRRALHVRQEPARMKPGQNVSAAWVQPIQRLVSARAVRLQTSSTVLIRRAQAAVLDRCRTIIAQRV
jgi:hypothetical protein